MDAVVDPSAEYLFDNIMEIVRETGIIDKTPKTDGEWKEVRRRAVMLVEAPNLLVTPGRKVSQPGEKAEYPEVELGPEMWTRRVRAVTSTTGIRTTNEPVKPPRKTASSTE
jgi:hypothetical protein